MYSGSGRSCTSDRLVWPSCCIPFHPCYVCYVMLWDPPIHSRARITSNQIKSNQIKSSELTRKLSLLVGAVPFFAHTYTHTHAQDVKCSKLHVHVFICYQVSFSVVIQVIVKKK
ncbi:hypothetical protein M3J09_000778 [Ascochyta lentis]